MPLTHAKKRKISVDTSTSLNATLKMLNILLTRSARAVGKIQTIGKKQTHKKKLQAFSKYLCSIEGQKHTDK